MFYTNKAIIIPIIRTRRPSKYQQILVEQQPDPETNLNKASDIWLIPGYDDMVQHIRPINKKVSQDISLFGEKKMSSNTHTRNHT